MAVNYEDFVRVEVNQGAPHRSFLNRVLGEGDGSANRFGVEVFSKGAAEDLTGAACIGYFIRPDGVTLILPGAVSGNRAWVNIPEAGYAKTGSFELTLKVIKDGRNATMRIVDGTVTETTTGTISDPGSVIPSLASLTALVAQAEAAAATINGLQVAAAQLAGTRYEIAVTKEE